MDNLVWAEQEIRDLKERVENLERAVKYAQKKKHPLFEYFEKNWKRKPYPVIDHSLRIDQNLDGTFRFYIHPSNTGGDTLDLVMSETELTKADV